MPLNLTYRPKSLDEFYGNANLKESIASIFEREDKPRAWLFTGPRGCGKCVSGDTLIYTNNGLEKIENYKKSDECGFTKLEIPTLGLNGFSNSSHFFEEEAEKCIKITNRLGIELVGTEEHPILILDKNLNYIYKTLGSIEEGDAACLLTNFDKQLENKFEIKYNHPERKKGDYNSIDFEIPKRINEDLARLMGYLIANGCNSNNIHFNFSTKNEKIREDIFSILDKLKQPYGKIQNIDFSIGSLRFYKFMCYLMDCDKLPTARYKTIPNCIMQSPINIKINFIQGLIDCDSWSRDGIFLEYCTASEKLARQLQIMLLGLGLITTLNSKYLKKYNHTYWRLNINGENYDKYFELCKSLKYNHIKKERNNNINTIPYLRDNIKEEIYLLRKKLGVDKSGRFKFNGERRIFTICEHSQAKEATKRWLSFLIKKSFGIYDIPDVKKIIDKCQSFLSSDLVFSKIIKKEECPSTIVYDFVIPKEHNFIGNGYINHNTSMSRIIADNYGCNKEDYQEYDLSNTGGIEEAREIKRTVNYKPLGGKYKFYCLEEIHRSSPNFQDGLLRTVEEGPEHAVFILCTTDAQKLIPALKSRCFQYEVKPLQTPIMMGLLRDILKKENVDNFPKEALDLIVEFSKGIPREAIILLDEVIDIPTDEGVIAFLKEKKASEEATESLAKLLLQKADWKEVSKALKGMKEQDSEKMRNAVLGYCSKVLLDSGNKRAGMIMDIFALPMYSFNLLVLASYKVIL